MIHCKDNRLRENQRVIIDLEQNPNILHSSFSILYSPFSNSFDKLFRLVKERETESETE